MDENESKQHEPEPENESKQHEPEAESASETIAHQNETNNKDTFNELDMETSPARRRMPAKGKYASESIDMTNKMSELPPLCSDPKLFGHLPESRTQTATVAFPHAEPSREVERKTRKCILNLNICVLFDYADVEKGGILENAQFTAFLGMLDIPSARLRLQKYLPEIESHINGINYDTFKHYLMKVCTTDSKMCHDFDEAAVAIATLIRKIRKDARHRLRNVLRNRARHRENPTKQPPAPPPRRIARIPSTIGERIERHKSSKKVQPVDMPSRGHAAVNATGVSAFSDDVKEDEKSTSWSAKLLDKIKHEIILVDQMHIQVLFALLWLVLGTGTYLILQQWTIAQSFYFMVQAGFSVGFGAFSEDFFYSKNMPSCVQVTHGSSWEWLEHLGRNQTFPLSDVLPSERFDSPTGYLDLPVGWGLDETRYVEICPKWPWTTFRSDLCKFFSTVFIITGSAISGWIFSLIGETLVEQRTTWCEEQEAKRQEARADAHRRTMKNIQARGVDRTLTSAEKTEECKQKEHEARKFFQIISEWCADNWIWLALILWILIGIVYGMIAEKFRFFTALEFAVAAISTGGLQAPQLLDQEGFMAFMGFYVLGGVPIYSLALGKLAGIIMQSREEKEAKLQLKKRTGSTKEFIQAVDYLGEIAGKAEHGARLDFSRYMMWELMRMGKIEFPLLKDLRGRFDALDIGGDGWIDLEEFNMALTFEKYKTTDEQLGLYFAEFKNLVGALLADNFVISKHDAYKTPQHPFVNKAWLEQPPDTPEDQRLENISSELWRQFDAFSHGRNSPKEISDAIKSGTVDNTRYLTTLDFFEWTNEHSVVKLKQAKDSTDDRWAKLTHKWEAVCAKHMRKAPAVPGDDSGPKETGPEDEKAKKEKFAMDLATFILQYEMEDARPGPTFAKGDWVQILKKEDDKTGWIVRVVDPSSDGLVEVQDVNKDGWVRTYDPQDLRKLKQLMR